MNPLQTRLYCPYDDTLLDWLWSKPVDKRRDAAYESEYGCSCCGYRTQFYSGAIVWSDDQEAMDFGALG